MRKKLLPLFILLAMTVFVGCGNEEELDAKQAKIDSLENVLNENENENQAYQAEFEKIKQNLDEIKRKEHLIDLNTGNEEISADAATQINDDITQIYQLMENNKKTLASLRKKLANSGSKNKQLQEMLTLYEKQINDKDGEITVLREKLDKMNINIQDLENKVEDMQGDIDTLEQINQEQDQTINEQDAKLHTIYYVLGNKEELKKNNVLSKNGILSKLSLDPNFNKSYFTKVDYRNLDEVPINSKKAEVLTQHPSDSYSLEENKNQITKLIIKDKDKFWSLSKFLVILVK